jgi:hypothetical protein
MSNLKDQEPAMVLRERLRWLRARYDWGQVSPALYAVIKAVETDVAWTEHNQARL